MSGEPERSPLSLETKGSKGERLGKSLSNGVTAIDAVAVVGFIVVLILFINFYGRDWN